MNITSVNTIYTSENLKQSMWKLVPPIAIQNLLTAIISASDAIMLGMLDEHSLSAATLGGQLMQIFNYVIIALSVGTTALAAQYYGKKDQKSVQKVLYIALQISVLTGLLFALPCFLFPRQIMCFYTNDPTIIELGTKYVRYISPAYLFMSFSQIYMIIMKNIGRVKRSSIYGGSAVVINIILNAVLIFGLFGMPQLGVAGAAIATSISRFIEFSLTLIDTRCKNFVTFNFKGFFTNYKALQKKYIRYTLPSFLQIFLWVTASSFTTAIIGHISTEAVAASAVALIVFNIAASIFAAFTSGGGIILGQQLGSGDLDSAKECGNSLIKGSLVLGSIVGGIVIVGSLFITKFPLSLSAQAVAYLKWMLIIMGIKCVGKAINHTLSTGIMPAGGDIIFILKMDIINMWFIILPLGLLAAFVFKLPVIAVFFIVNMDEYTKMYFTIHHFHQYLWLKNLTKREWAEPKKYNRLLKEEIANNMPVGIMVIGSSGRITLTNKALLSILEYSQEEIEGEIFSTCFLSDERNNDFSQVILDAVYDKSKPVEKLVDYYKNDVHKRLLMHTSFVQEEDSNIGVLAMIEDLSKYTK